MKVVALSRVHKLSHLLLYPIPFEWIQKVYRSNILPIIPYAYAELNLKFDTTKELFSGL